MISIEYNIYDFFSCEIILVMVDSNNLQVVLFSYANPFVDSLRLDTRSLPIFKKTLTFRQRWTEGGKGGTEIGFGASVYNCSIVLALYLESNFQLVCARQKELLNSSSKLTNS